MEISEKWRPEYQHEVDFVSSERSHCTLVVEDVYVKLHEREAGTKAGDLLRQEFEGERLAASNAYGATPQSLEILDLRLQALDIGGLLADVAHEQLAG